MGLTGTEIYAEILELVARGDVLVKERLRLRERNPARKVLHLPLQMLWILIGERRDALKYAKC